MKQFEVEENQQVFYTPGEFPNTTTVTIHTESQTNVHYNVPDEHLDEYIPRVTAEFDEESIEDKNKAIEDAIQMNHNMRLYGTIDAPTSIHERAVARYVYNTEQSDNPVSETVLEFFNGMAACVVHEANKLIAKGEPITDEVIAELCQEVWRNFNED